MPQLCWVSSNLVPKQRPLEKIRRQYCFVASVVLKFHYDKMNVVQKILSLILYAGHCGKQVCMATIEEIHSVSQPAHISTGTSTTTSDRDLFISPFLYSVCLIDNKSSKPVYIATYLLEYNSPHLVFK